MLANSHARVKPKTNRAEKGSGLFLGHGAGFQPHVGQASSLSQRDVHTPWRIRSKADSQTKTQPRCYWDWKPQPRQCTIRRQHDPEPKGQDGRPIQQQHHFRPAAYALLRSACGHRVGRSGDPARPDLRVSGPQRCRQDDDHSRATGFIATESWSSLDSGSRLLASAGRGLCATSATCLAMFGSIPGSRCAKVCGSAA